MNNSTAFVAALRAALPPASVLSDQEDTRPYECDGLSAYRQLPMAVALPADEAQVLAVLRICRQFNVPIVPRGAGTGLSGGAMPIADGLVLSTARMNQILRVDAYARTAVVQPGVRNLAISEAAEPSGLYYAPDPSSQIACTIGGNVAENSGGVHCLKYGLTVHNVLRVRMVAIEGDVVELGGESLDAPGLDLLAAFVGSEGMLGIVTEVTVKLVPKPASARVIMASFNEVAASCSAVADVIAAGIIPAGLEMMDRTSSRMVEPFVRAGYDTDAAAILLCEADGTVDEVEEEIARMTAVLQAAGASAVLVSGSEAERLKFWSGRKNAFPAAGRISPDYYCMDGTIPRKQLARVLLGIGQMEAKYALRCANVFHAGDGNLHPLILFDANRPDELQRAEAFGAEILALCVAVGGTITGEHGVGIEKIDSMCAQFSDAELAAFSAVKQAFDPLALLNPNKAIPTLNRCAEFGKMHVRAGRLPHAGLPRF
ncbi:MULTISPECIES: FAD-linked oxidase C-terminal domain-containing protein [unclassified Duganella]|uniref:FAD-linked oxidase C-terminal domain-containing protein n=1 Tax=unclassified Duganella TaxID=2636909 RepID=UPI0006F9F437|nr:MULTISPECIES: FAD-linked oxidase C-terminal domain-containing protein [unclassified Duganella]KQV51063.1 glycolate oxidase subunit GlcD [Duganella sp. Root336D2]KRC00644.1 glycolate oxidase subunit GlcD [Duganella sp. Root198D2]